MNRKGYVLSAVILAADMLFPFGGWLLAAAAAAYAFGFGEALGRRGMGAIPCDPALGQKHRKLQECFDRVCTKIEAAGEEDSSRLRSIGIYYIPTQKINAYTFGRSTIGITDGTLNLDSRTIEALIAHEIGHILRGDAVLHMVLAVHTLGITAMLSLWQFAFVAVIWLIVGIGCLCGTMRFTYLSHMLTTKLAAGIRWIGQLMQNSILAGCQAIIRRIGRKGELLADQYACSLGYGLYLRSFLTRFSQTQAQRTYWDVLYATHPTGPERIARIDQLLQQDFRSSAEIL